MATTTRILVINPGSTSTKIAIYQQEKVIFLKTIKHPVEELKGFTRITDQYEYRKNKIHEESKNADIPFETTDAATGRGGSVMPIEAGGCPEKDAMRKASAESRRGE